MDVIREGSYYTSWDVGRNSLPNAIERMRGVIANGVSATLDVLRKDSDAISGIPAKKLSTGKGESAPQFLTFTLVQLPSGDDFINASTQLCHTIISV